MVLEHGNAQTIKGAGMAKQIAREQGTATSVRLIPVIAVICATFAMLLVSWAGKPDTRIYVESGFVGDHHYAVTSGRGRGSTLYFGPLNGASQLAVQSSGDLSGPFIVNQNRLLVAEQLQVGTPNFRILQVTLSGTDVSCSILMSSERYLGYPILSTASKPNRLFFLSGDYNPEASGPSVVAHAITTLRGERPFVFEGPTFVSIDRLGQVSSDRFIASSFGYLISDNKGSGNAPLSSVLDIRLMGDKLTVMPFYRFGPDGVSAEAVTSAGDGDTAYIIWSDSTMNDNMSVSSVSIATGVQRDTFTLPKDRKFSSFFPADNAGGHLTGWVLSTSGETGSRSEAIMVTEFSKGQIIEENAVKLDASRRLDTTSCP